MSKSRRLKRAGWSVGVTMTLMAPGAQVRGQETPRPEAWSSALELLAGTWEGEIDGKLGVGKGMRRYEFVLGGRFLLSRHLSVRLPQAKSAKGDQHEEIGVFSYDTERKTIVYREFMVEGVVVQSPCAVTGTKVVCTSESVESGPGIRARLTLEIADRFRFTEKYELAFPGEELQPYVTVHWTRSAVPRGWN